MTKRGCLARGPVLRAGFALLFSVLAGGAAAAEDIGPLDRGNDGDLTAIALITDDTNWRSKWITPPETRPDLSLASPMCRGDQLFFSGVDIDNGAADLLCDIAITGADGTRPVERRHMACGPDSLTQPKDYVFLTTLVGGILANENEVPGVITISLRLTHSPTGWSVPLTVGVEILE